MNFIERYAEFLGSFLKIDCPIKIVFDSSNGTTGPILKKLFGENKLVGLDLINSEPDGDFPAHGPDFLSVGATDELKEKIIERGADFGAIFDGDGDRIMFLDETGRVINPYRVFLCLKDSFDPPYALDVRALADFSMPEMDVLEEKVGRYHLIRTMKGKNLDFGAEFSGHYYFKDFFYCDSGILTSVFMANFVSKLKKERKLLSREIDSVTKVEWAPSINLQIADKEGALRRVEEHYSKDKSAKTNKLDGISVLMGDFAFNIRPSNTEDLVRLTIAAKNRRILDEKLAEIEKMVMGPT